MLSRSNMNRLRENFNGYNSRQNVYRYAEICHAITIIKTNKSLHPLACINGKQKPPFPSRPLLYQFTHWNLKDNVKFAASYVYWTWMAFVPEQSPC